MNDKQMALQRRCLYSKVHYHRPGRFQLQGKSHISVLLLKLGWLSNSFHFKQQQQQQHHRNTSVTDLLSAITRAKGEEAKKGECSYMDIRDNNCESNKTPAAVKHFNSFLKGYCDSKGYNDRIGFDPITKAEQIPCNGLDDIQTLE